MFDFGHWRFFDFEVAHLISAAASIAARFKRQQRQLAISMFMNRDDQEHQESSMKNYRERSRTAHESERAADQTFLTDALLRATFARERIRNNKDHRDANQRRHNNCDHGRTSEFAVERPADFAPHFSL